MTIYKCIQQSINYVVPPIAITSFSIDTHWCSQYIYYIIKDTASNICSSLDCDERDGWWKKYLEIYYIKMKY